MIFNLTTRFKKGIQAMFDPITGAKIEDVKTTNPVSQPNPVCEPIANPVVCVHKWTTGVVPGGRVNICTLCGFTIKQ